MLTKRHTVKIATKFIGVLVLGALLLAGFPAHAWDGVVTGRVFRIDTVPGQSNGFRVYMQNYPAMCTGGENYGFMNESDAMFKATAALLLSAKLTDRTVVIATTNSVNGTCQIGFVSVSG